MNGLRGFFAGLLAVGCVMPVDEPANAELVMMPPSPDRGIAAVRCAPPEGPYGVSVGRVLPPMTLETCAGEPFEFYGADFCQARLTVLHLRTNHWCGPDWNESGELQHIVDTFTTQELRAVELVLATSSGGAPDASDCERWRDRHGLEIPVVMDPGYETSFGPLEGGSGDHTLILDREGRVRYRHSGGEHVLTAVIENLLASDLP